MQDDSQGDSQIDESTKQTRKLTPQIIRRFGWSLGIGLVFVLIGNGLLLNSTRPSTGYTSGLIARGSGFVIWLGTLFTYLFLPWLRALRERRAAAAFVTSGLDSLREAKSNTRVHGSQLLFCYVCMVICGVYSFVMTVVALIAFFYFVAAGGAIAAFEWLFGAFFYVCLPFACSIVFWVLVDVLKRVYALEGSQLHSDTA